jgi:hypothetical protein
VTNRVDVAADPETVFARIALKLMSERHGDCVRVSDNSMVMRIKEFDLGLFPLGAILAVIGSVGAIWLSSSVWTLEHPQEVGHDFWFVTAFVVIAVTGAALVVAALLRPNVEVAVVSVERSDKGSTITASVLETPRLARTLNEVHRELTKEATGETH